GTPRGGWRTVPMAVPSSRARALPRRTMRIAMAFCLLESRRPPASRDAGNNPYAVCLAVAHVQLVPDDEHAVRPRQRTPPGIRLGAIASFARAEHGADDAGVQVDAADRMVLGVGHEEPAGRPRQALRPAARRVARMAPAPAAP